VPKKRLEEPETRGAAADRGAGTSGRYDAETMALASLLAALVALVAVVAAAAFLAVRALAAWRTYRSFSLSATAALDAVMTSAEAAEKRAASASAAAGAERLSAANLRLQASLEQLAVIRAAASEFTRTLARMRGLAPRK
jgi:hypothetical protein